MRNVATKSIGLKVVIKDSNGNYSTGEWMQNPEKGCPNFAKSEASREVPTLLRQYITELMLCGQEQQLRFVSSEHPLLSYYE